jgi:hypothetical protein
MAAMSVAAAPPVVKTAGPSSTPIPPPPSITTPTFAAQVSGRNALSDAFYAAMTVPRSGHSSQWRFVTADESGKVTTDLAGTETVLWDRPTNRAVLVSASVDLKSVTRYVMDGNYLLCASLNGDKRTYYRIPLQSGTRLPGNALLSVDADKGFMGAITRMALFTRVEEGALRSPCLVYTEGSGDVIEQAQPQDEGGHRKIVFWRYRIALGSHRILSREQWDTWQDSGKPVIVRAYWGDTMSAKPPAVTAGTFATVPAKGYTEVPPPSTTRTLPVAPVPSNTAPKARALLTRWTRSWARFTSYQAQVHMREWQAAPSPESIAPTGEGDREATVDVSYQRPGRLFMYTRPAGKKTPFNLVLTTVSDGSRFVIYEGEKQNKKRGEGANVDDLYMNDALRNNGLHDFSEILPRILRNPREIIGNSDEIRYRGILPLPNGGTAEALTFVERFGDAGPIRLSGGVGVPNWEQIVTLYFDGKTGMPTRSEFELRYLLTGKPGVLLRDLPPKEFRVADFSGIRLNEEFSPTLFQLSH